MWDKLNKVFKTILESNTLIQSVYDFEASNLEGIPAATITPSANENEYTSTTENRRTYSFVIRLYMSRESGNDNENVTEQAMRQLVDTVLDDLDKNDRLTTLETKTGYCFLWSAAAPSAWGYAGRENLMRVAEITVTAQFDIDINTIN